MRATPARNVPDGGYSLLELLLVAIIIGILAGIAIPLYLNLRNNGLDDGVKSDLRSVAVQEESYYTQTQNYGTFVAIDPGAKQIRLTRGVTVTIERIAPYSFCLSGVNAQSGSVYFYDSIGGGLQPKGTGDCPATTSGAAGGSRTG